MEEHSYMSSDSASKRLATGTVVYMIGNLMSKILQMLILPIITVSLVTTEYGYYDLIVTTISLATPIVTCQIIEGMFRYMFNSNLEEQRRTVSTVTVFLGGSFVICAGALFAFKMVVPSLQYPVLIFLNYVSAIIFNYTQKLARCRQKNLQFAFAGVIHTAVMLATQALTLICFHMGVDGMLIANFASYIVASIYLSFYLDLKKWINIKEFDKNTFTNLIKYSLPLVPNSICWWLVSSSDRYIITFFLGAAANGVYSIAGKFSQLLTFATSVFQLAWQESAIIEENSKERDLFYTNTFNTYMKLLLGGYLVILPFIRLIMPVLVAESYLEGYLYNPILLLGAILSAFSQFYGSAYLVFKKTGGAFSTTVIAAIVNIAIGVLLTPKLGLFAPALGTAVSFGVQWLIRMWQMRNYFKVKIDKKSLIIIMSFVVMVTAVYYSENIHLQILSMVIGTIVCLLVNRQMIGTILKKVGVKK